MPFKKGQSGNPNGRPKSAKNKLTESFLSVLLDDWELNGTAAIVRCREEDPVAYCKMVAAMVPKEIMVSSDLEEIEAMTDKELDAELAEINRAIHATATKAARRAAGKAAGKTTH